MPADQHEVNSRKDDDIDRGDCLSVSVHYGRFSVTYGRDDKGEEGEVITPSDAGVDVGAVVVCRQLDISWVSPGVPIPSTQLPH